MNNAKDKKVEAIAETKESNTNEIDKCTEKNYNDEESEKTSERDNVNPNNELNKMLLGRKIHTLNSDETENENFEFIYESALSPANKRLSDPMMWHVKLGHASKQYLISFAKINSDKLNINEISRDTSISECEICLMTKCCKLPFTQTRTRAIKPLQILHADMMGPISPTAHPKEFRFVLVLIDDYSRVASTYPMKRKNETANCIRECVKSLRNAIGVDEKVCYLRCDRGTEFTSNETIEVLNSLGAELQLACPDTPEHNGVAERFNRTLETKVRAMMLDSGSQNLTLHPSMWNLAVRAATYIYNRTPHKSIDMLCPIYKLNPKYKIKLEQIRRFGCIAYAKIPRNIGTKFGVKALRGCPVGYLALF